MSQKKLPLRIGVGAIVLNNENKIFVGKRIDNPVDKWQMPQGGVNKDENFTKSSYQNLLSTSSLQIGMAIPIKWLEKLIIHPPLISNYCTEPNLFLPSQNKFK